MSFIGKPQVLIIMDTLSEFIRPPPYPASSTSQTPPQNIPAPLACTCTFHQTGVCSMLLLCSNRCHGPAIITATTLVDSDLSSYFQNSHAPRYLERYLDDGLGELQDHRPVTSTTFVEPDLPDYTECREAPPYLPSELNHQLGEIQELIQIRANMCVLMEPQPVWNKGTSYQYNAVLHGIYYGSATCTGY